MGAQEYELWTYDLAYFLDANVLIVPMGWALSRYYSTHASTEIGTRMDVDVFSSDVYAAFFQEVFEIKDSTGKTILLGVTPIVLRESIQYLIKEIQIRELSKIYPLQNLKKMTQEEIASKYYKKIAQDSVSKAMEQLYSQAFTILNALLNSVQIVRFELGESVVKLRKLKDGLIDELLKFPLLLSDATVLAEAAIYRAHFFVTTDYRTIRNIYGHISQVMSDFFRKNKRTDFTPPQVVSPEQVFKWDKALLRWNF